MGVQNVRVALEKLEARKAVLTWLTTDDFGNPLAASTEGRLCKVDPASGTCTPAPLGAQGGDTVNHEYVFDGLDPDSEYICVAVSRSADGVLPCDSDPLNPTDPHPCTKRFRTKQDVGEVDGISVVTSNTEISVGGRAKLTLKAKVGSAQAPAGRPINFTIINGNGVDRGRFFPDPASTNGTDTVEVDFVADHEGKAKIQVSCQKAVAQVDIKVRP